MVSFDSSPTFLHLLVFHFSKGDNHHDHHNHYQSHEMRVCEKENSNLAKNLLLGGKMKLDHSNHVSSKIIMKIKQS